MLIPSIKETEIADNYIVLGRAGSAWGIHGWLKIKSYTAEENGILAYNPWYFAMEQGWEAFEVLSGEKKGRLLLAKLNGFDSPEQIDKLAGKEIAIKRSQLPPAGKDEYYWTDLTGLSVVDLAEKELGIVVSLLETGSNDVLVIKQGKTEFALPWLPDRVIKKVDIAAKKIIADWEPI